MYGTFKEHVQRWNKFHSPQPSSYVTASQMTLEVNRKMSYNLWDHWENRDRLMHKNVHSTHEETWMETNNPDTKKQLVNWLDFSKAGAENKGSRQVSESDK